MLAFVAKQTVPEAWSFIWMETGYLLLQFGLFGLIIAVIHRGGPSRTQLPSRSSAARAS